MLILVADVDVALNFAMYAVYAGKTVRVSNGMSIIFLHVQSKSLIAAPGTSLQNLFKRLNRKHCLSQKLYI